VTIADGVVIPFEARIVVCEAATVLLPLLYRINGVRVPVVAELV